MNSMILMSSSELFDMSVPPAVASNPWPGDLRSIDLNHSHASHNISFKPSVKIVIIILAS